MLSHWEIGLVIIVAILLFGAKRLPEIGRALGRAIKEFKKAGKDIKSDIEEVAKEEDEEKKVDEG
ncbi:twin-arginine translocase TatA/TatE family subunit [bacterium]|nr:twin-arginine translocase TatA/TatE family subunit [bacterium]MCK4325704.1 twin-arginine translocase TatA/TatE family subunit [bacterium]MCK4436409.1 twin-arginine translocase TatA/TatE family subunit [bacterium]